MGKVIWKFPLQVTDIQYVEMPENAEILTVQTQHELPMLWAKVDENYKGVEKRTVYTVGTGNPLPEELNGMDYLGTYQIMAGALVFHVWIYK